MKRTAFTLMELLITIAIISLLTGILVTNVSRSLSKNKLADDVALMESKVEYVRLLAGSAQQNSGKPGLQADADSSYYALEIPAGAGQTTYPVVRLSSDLNSGTCSIASARLTNACLVDTITLSGGVTLTNPNPDPILIAFRAPVKELVSFIKTGATWQVAATTTFPSPAFQLTFNGQTATINVDNFTGKLTTGYN